jgi:hypothetical protein
MVKNVLYCTVGVKTLSTSVHRVFLLEIELNKLVTELKAKANLPS